MAELRNQDDPIVLNQVMVLRMLLTRPYNLSDLAKEHMVSLPTMSNTASRMVKQGWGTRTRSQADRRVVLIELTAVGRARLESVLHHFANNIAARLTTLAPDETEELERGLRILKNIFLAFIFMAAGIYAATQLNLEMTPRVEIPQTIVIAQWPGAYAAGIQQGSGRHYRCRIGQSGHGRVDCRHGADIDRCSRHLQRARSIGP